MKSNESRLLRNQLKILSKMHTWEILSHIIKGAKFITQISREMNLPYTTVQHRVQEMERANLVTMRNEIDDKTGKAVKLVRASHFKLILEPKVFAEIVEKERGAKV